MNENASTAPFTHPDRYTRGTDAAMYNTLGLPVPTAAHVSRYPHTDPRGQQARTLTAADLAQTSAIPSRRAVTRSHRHHRESEA